jgi:hypothetical protein
MEALVIGVEKAHQAAMAVTVETPACFPYLGKAVRLVMGVRAAKVEQVEQVVLGLHQVEMVVRAVLAGVAAVWEERQVNPARVAGLAQAELVERMVLLV